MQKTKGKNWKKINIATISKENKKNKKMPPTGPPRPEYDMKPYYGPGFRPAVGPEGPSGKATASRPESLRWRGAREGCGSGAYKPLRAPLD